MEQHVAGAAAISFLLGRGWEGVFFIIIITRLVLSSSIKSEEGWEGVFFIIIITREEASMSRGQSQRIQDHEAARSPPLHSALKRVAGPALALSNLVVGPTRSY